MKLEEKQEILRTGDFCKLSVQQAKEWLEDLKQANLPFRGCGVIACYNCVGFKRNRDLFKFCYDFINHQLNEVLKNNYSVCFGSKTGPFTPGENVFYGGVPSELLTKNKNKMTKIKFKLLKFEKALVFQVLEMDERFRNQNSLKEFKSKNIDIFSAAGPNINSTKNAIFLRGSNKDNDLKITTELFKSNSDRDKHFDKIIAALQDWAENWEGFKEPEPVINANDNDVYEF